MVCGNDIKQMYTYIKNLKFKKAPTGLPVHGLNRHGHEPHLQLFDYCKLSHVSENAPYRFGLGDAC